MLKAEVSGSPEKDCFEVGLVKDVCFYIQWPVSELWGCCCSVTKLYPTLCDSMACQGPLSSTVSWGWLKFMAIESVMLSSHLILHCSLLLLPSIFPSIRVFFNESALPIRWPKHWSFSTNPFNEYWELIFFRIDWFYLLDIQGISENLLPHHNLKASILQRSAFFMVQLSHPYMTTGKTVALTIQMSVGKVMSLLFNTLARFVTVFLPRSKYLLISWMQHRTLVLPSLV